MNPDLVKAIRDGFLTLTMSSSGGEIEFARGSEFRLLDGVEGFGPTAVEYTSTPLAGGGGVRQHSRFMENELYLPIELVGESPADLFRLRRLLESVILADGAGTEVTVKVDSSEAVRTQVAYLDGGGHSYTLGGESSHFTWQKMGLTLAAPDPLWRGASRRTAWALSTVIKPYWTSFPRLPHYPAWLSSSTILGRREFTISGDADTHPVWEFRGTGEDLLIQCNHCGERIFIEGEVPDGLRIDTRPHIDDITAPGWDPADLWDKVSDDTSLFHLQPGSQEVTMSVVGATGTTEIILTYEEQWMAGY